MGVSVNLLKTFTQRANDRCLQSCIRIRYLHRGSYTVNHCLEMDGK